MADGFLQCPDYIQSFFPSIFSFGKVWAVSAGKSLQMRGHLIFEEFKKRLDLVHRHYASDIVILAK